MRAVRALVATVLLCGPSLALASASFPRPASLEPQVRFWRAIFAVYSRYQVVVHDTVDLDKIYAVLDFRSGASQLGPVALERWMDGETDAALARVRETLRRFHASPPSREALDAEARRIFDLVQGDRSPTKFLDAADRVRTQRGLKEKFGEGIRTAHGYFPEMEAIFRDEGLPVELTRLPLVESCFNVAAYSKVGAAGIWQFMPATGRLYDLTVSGGVDERRDPIAATRSAARFLRHNYQMLEGQWPLALTAYNHGPAGMRRAINETGTTDIGVIVQRYRGPAFGFASRNFYAEFLAALDVEKHHRAYFGDLRFGVREPTRVVSLERPLGIEVAARLARVERDQLAALNPALLSPVVEGRQSIPAGYALRMPASGGQGFEDRLAELVAEEKVVRVASPAPPTRRGRSARSVASGRRQGRSEGVAAVRRRGSGDRPRSGAATKSKGAPKRGQTTRGSRRS